MARASAAISRHLSDARRLSIWAWNAATRSQLPRSGPVMRGLAARRAGARQALQFAGLLGQLAIKLCDLKHRGPGGGSVHCFGCFLGKPSFLYPELDTLYRHERAFFDGKPAGGL